MSRKMFGSYSAVAAAAAVFLCAASAANAAFLVTKWTFETGTSGNPPSASGTDITGVSPSTGTGTASGHHASSSTVWDNPSGNGSVESMSSNNWGIDDYYQFQTGSLGYSGLTFSFDQTGSGTGPKDFKVQYATAAGGPYTDVGTYAVLLNGGAPNASWSAGTAVPAYNFSFSLPATLDHQPALFLRLVDTSTTSTNGGTVGTGGTSRVDNVTVSAAIPEPTSVALFALGCVVLSGVRRRVAK